MEPHIYSVFIASGILNTVFWKILLDLSVSVLMLFQDYGFNLQKQVLRLSILDCSQSLEWSTLAFYAIGVQNLPDRTRLKVHPAKSPLYNCGQQWKLIINAYQKHWCLPHVLSKLCAGCTTCISSSFTHLEETAHADAGIIQTASWHDRTELADATAGCYDFSHGYVEVRRWQQVQ